MITSPLTGSNNVSLIENFPVQQLIFEWKRRFQIDVAEELCCQNVELYQCHQTGLKFFHPKHIAASNKLYEQLQHFRWYYMPQKWEHNIAISDLKHSRNVIEIGCGTGSFVNRLQNTLKINSLGIELNPHAVKEAQSLGIPVLNVNLYNLAEEQNNKFEAVCAFQVLEHVPDLKKFLSACVDITKKNGVLIFCVPNAESFLKDQFNILDLPPHHMSRWSVKTFEALENIFPIKLEKVSFEPLASYHISGYLDTYYRKYLSSPVVGKFLWNRLTMSIYRNILTLGLRKFLVGQSLYVKFRKLA